MRIHASKAYPSSWLAFLAGLSLVGSAQAFTPLSGPIAAAATAPANVILVLDNSSSMVMNQVGEETRLAVARRTAREVMAEHRHLRFGLFAFRASEGQGDQNRDAPGGELLVPVAGIDADTAAGQQQLARLHSAMDALAPAAGDDRDAWTWTPLAETYYELTRYLRGMRAFYPQSLGEFEREAFSSPIEYRCQRNAALLLTDGLPTYDREFPASLAQEPDGRRRGESSGYHLPDWDQNPANDLDGGDAMAEGSSFYLDDMAAFGYQIDLRPAAAGSDAAGQSWDDPAFVRQRLQTFIVGFELDDPRLRAAALAGGGQYASVSDAAALRGAMNKALVDIATTPGSGGGAAIADSLLQPGGSRYYQTRYDPADWSGSLSAHVLNAQGLPARQLWTTDNTLAIGQAAGQQQTWRAAENGLGGRAVTLDGRTLSQLSTAQQSALSAAAADAGLIEPGAGQQLLDWARGQRLPGLRQRRHQLGDVLNASPVLLSATPPATTQSASYAAYLARRQALPELILLGANDGFVRAFSGQGEQVYAYLPATLQPRLGQWARSDYGHGTRHLSGADGRIGVADVELPTGWSTLAAGGLGAGGKALFALQLLRPGASYAEPDLLWEVSADQPGWGDLGYLYAEPQLVTVAGQALLLTGNGYGSARGNAALLVVDALTGQLLHRIVVGDRAGTAALNGLAGLTLQQDEQAGLKAGFAGDQHGQLWKFDLSDADYHNWTVAHAGTPLFTAAAGQPINVAPVLHPSAQGKADLLLFGTGQFLQPADLSDTRSQAFYAVLDAPSIPSGGLTPAHLQAQKIVQEQPGEGDAPAVRFSSAEPVDWAQHYGWRLTLPGQGEKAYRAARIKDSRVLFSTGFVLGEGADPCVTRSGGWLMSLALDTGAMLPIATLDSNADGQVSKEDQPAAGLRLDIGLPGELRVLDLPPDESSEAQSECNPELYLVQGSAGPTAVRGQAHCLFERILWRQLL